MNRPFSVRYNPRFNEYEVLDVLTFPNASFALKDHAETWCACLNGFAYIVMQKPPVIEGETE